MNLVFEYPGECFCKEKITPGNTATLLSENCYKYKEWTFTFTGGGTLVPLVGNRIKGATSSATAMIVSIGTLTGGSWAGGDAAGTLQVVQQQVRRFGGVEYLPHLPVDPGL